MGHVYPTHDQPADHIEVGRRHRETFAQIPEWVALSDIAPQALALYVRLHMHVNSSRDDGVVWPGMDTLAEMMGYRRRQSVMPHLNALARIGALDIRRTKTPTGRRNVYVIHEVPRDDHAGPRSLAEFYRERYAQQDAEAVAESEGGMCGTAHVGTYATAHDPMCGAAHMNQTNGNQTKRTRRTTPPGEDDCASSGRKRVPDPKLIEANGYDDPDPGRAAQAVIRSYVKALGRVGVTPTDARKKKVGSWVKDNLEAGITRDNMWRAFCSAIDRAWAGDEKVAWMAPRPTDTGEWAA